MLSHRLLTVWTEKMFAWGEIPSSLDWPLPEPATHLDYVQKRNRRVDPVVPSAGMIYILFISICGISRVDVCRCKLCWITRPAAWSVCTVCVYSPHVAAYIMLDGLSTNCVYERTYLSLAQTLTNLWTQQKSPCFYYRSSASCPFPLHTDVKQPDKSAG